MMGEGAVMWPRDIYTEPSKVDVDTLRNLGPVSYTHLTLPTNREV